MQDHTENKQKSASTDPNQLSHNSAPTSENDRLTQKLHSHETNHDADRAQQTAETFGVRL